jgi:hypothetical protein
MYKKMQSLIPAIVLLFSGAAMAAVPRLFELQPGEVAPRQGASASWRVTVDADLVLDGASRLLLEMPDGLEFEARLRAHDRSGRGDASWVGRLVGSRDSEVILSAKEKLISGWVHSPFGDYEIFPVRGGDHAVARIDHDALPGYGPIAAPETEESETEAQQPSTPRAPATARDGAGSIDVMVLYSPGARDEAGGNPQIKSQIALMVDVANQAFANSRMGARLRVAFAGVTPFEMSGNPVFDMFALLEDTRVANLRNTHKADLVALVVETNNVYCSVAMIQRQVGPAFAPYAYSITALPCTLAFAHGIGRNLGFEPDPANGPPPQEASFPWAFGHFVKNNFRTVMAMPQPCGNCEQILHFSNPRVNYGVHPTGVENHRDNVRVARVTAPIVANFRLSGVVFEEDFEGSDLGNWSTIRSGFELVEPGLEGSAQALAVPLGGTSALKYLAHKASAPGTGIDVEFLLNMSSAQLGDAEIAVLELMGQGQRHVRATVRHDGPSYRLTLYAKANDNAYREIASTPLRAAATERIAIVWRAATGPDEADGYVRLVKNGGPRGTVNDLANDRRSVGEVRIGVPGGSVGAEPGGTFLIDDYRATVPIESEGGS